MVAQRVLFEVHKTFKQALEDQSKPFFAWLEQVLRSLFLCHQFLTLGLYSYHIRIRTCLQLYGNLPQSYSGTVGVMQDATEQVHANCSFKLASEVALMIVFLFQCYPRRLQEHAATLLPLMVKVSYSFELIWRTKSLKCCLNNSVCASTPGGLNIWACTVRCAGSQNFSVQRFSSGPNQVAGFSHCHRSQPESAATDAATQGCNLQRHRSRHADRA